MAHPADKTVPENRPVLVNADAPSVELKKAKKKNRRLRKGVFVLPSLLTTGNIFCGFYSATETLAGAQALSLGDVALATEHFDRAAINIGVAALFDLLDGRIARMTGATSEFGVELDSIADVLSFGVAPGLLAFAWGYGSYPGLHKIGWAVSFVFVITGALRLARFNVQARQPNINQPVKPGKADKKAFVGLPIPTGAALIAALAHFSPVPFAGIGVISWSVLGREVTVGGQFLSVGLILVTLTLAFLMVSTIRYSSFKGAGTRKYHPRVLILGLALLVLAIWFYSRWTLLIMATLYVSQGIVGKLLGMLRPRRSE